MARDRGKEFEDRFRKDWLETFPESFLYRIPDQMSQYKGTSSNPCDFLAYMDGILYMIECKSHAGASMPFSEMPQHERLLEFGGIKGVRRGFILWLYEKDWIKYIPEETITQMKKDGEKSVGLRHDGKYHMIDIPSKKLRVFMKSDYTILKDLKEGE